MTKLWRAAVNWFETGDLVPLLVIISAWHYASVLANKDAWPVAIAIGLLVDLGHYRVVRVAVRYQTSKPAMQGRTGKAAAQRRAWRWNMAMRAAIAVSMTAVSLNYHQRYYEDWWLSAPLPLLIAALAWLQQVEPRAKAEKVAPPIKIEQMPPALQQPPIMPVLLEAPAEQTIAGFICSDCAYEAKSQKALNGHKLKHRAKVDA